MAARCAARASRRAGPASGTTVGAVGGVASRALRPPLQPLALAAAELAVMAAGQVVVVAVGAGHHQAAAVACLAARRSIVGRAEREKSEAKKGRSHKHSREEKKNEMLSLLRASALATARTLLASSAPASRVSLPLITARRTGSSLGPPLPTRKNTMATHAGAPSSDQPAYETIDVTEAAARLAAGTPLLDVRAPDEFEGGHPPGAKSANVQADGFLAAATALFPEKSAPLLVSCLRGGRSAAAAAQLTAAGYTNVTNVAGGWAAWTEAGLPVEK